MSNELAVIDTIESMNFNVNIDSSKRTIHVWDNTNKDSKKKDYELLTNKVIKSLDFFLFQICKLDSVDNDRKESLKDFFNVVEMCITEAEARIILRNLDCDKNLLYYLCATKHILECILDAEFFELTGGYKYPQDILEFGREVYVISKKDK
ncbi:hypothetical protein DCO58_08325 [Helicobacter saguini]|uniref:Uncharacterized protein n=1 Tax=Helicobacter saguini TaxID=1548018 RepID=A0A347VNR2_9HELI|nr:hypothetical protein [Helicobacter saguini]MWV61670.1 hypothetical protein [Helicobacter saguini]MWV67657.1 hypothetical protein [Helicobacter saguini]MWV70010.1 hypothetical protein [Helicobacter saguini]MWV72777.1 hypothetical protein [Helicobacter saguini]TLD92711.1 hypothetical protein LS64_009820 [Helicobacter saguini]